MKFFVIFLCFASVSAIDDLKLNLSGPNILLLLAHDYRTERNFTSEKFECVEKYLRLPKKDVSEYSALEEEFEEIFYTINRNRELWNETMQKLIDTSIGLTFQICDEELPLISPQNLKSYKEEEQISKNLNCMMSRLKQLEPELEIVKNFNKSPNCTEFLDESRNKSSESTKCKHRDVGGPYEALFLELIVTAKLSNSTTEEISKNFRGKALAFLENFLKCHLDQIYEN